MNWLGLPKSYLLDQFVIHLIFGVAGGLGQIYSPEGLSGIITAGGAVEQLTHIDRKTANIRYFTKKSFVF